MLKRLKAIHPGWFIAGFFAVLIVFNVVFFAIAASTPVDLIPRDGSKKSAVLEPAAPEAGTDAGAAAVKTPAEPATPR
ncbi:MAG: hypothetical protein EP329_04205 [Deltaproteobacteria bacterium]|nr:MAG: hypothetical protein EP329_04205 [Deltaproteobacteria bacterium]